MPKAADTSSSESSKRLLPGQLIWLWLTGVVIALDQITKHMVVARFDLYERLEVMPFFNLTLAYNPGAAFSFLADAGGWQRWFFTAIALGASVLILGLADPPHCCRETAGRSAGAYSGRGPG